MVDQQSAAAAAEGHWLSTCVLLTSAASTMLQHPTALKLKAAHHVHLKTSQYTAPRLSVSPGPASHTEAAAGGQPAHPATLKNTQKQTHNTGHTELGIDAFTTLPSEASHFYPVSLTSEDLPVHRSKAPTRPLIPYRGSSRRAARTLTNTQNAHNTAHTVPRR
jgi:hypothetical protein